jgi:hypothetical protein
MLLLMLVLFVVDVVADAVAVWTRKLEASAHLGQTHQSPG